MNSLNDMDRKIDQIAESENLLPFIDKSEKQPIT